MIELSRDSLVSRERHGGKAVGLHALLVYGLPIPPTIIFEPGEFAEEGSLQKLQCIFADSSLLIARSSAPQEDGKSISYAGAFHSAVFKINEFRDAIRNVTEENRRIQVAYDGCATSIPLVIQPYYGASPGGVFLRDAEGLEVLTVSRLGPSSVTNGSATDFSLFSDEEPFYRNLKKVISLELRSVPGALDVEFVVVDGMVLYLQFRPLSKPLTHDSHKENFRLRRSSHFPFALTRFEESVWQPLLEAYFPTSVVFRNRVVYEVGAATQSVNKQIPDEAELLWAEKYYSSLFKKWQEMYSCMLSSMSEASNSRELLRRVWVGWREFYDEYFGNEAAPTIEAVYQLGVSGGSACPSHVEWTRALAELTLDDADCPKLAAFRERFSYMLSRANYITSASIVDQPKRLRLLIDCAKNSSLVEPVINPSLLLRVAWLSDEDNVYKLKFNYLLRMAVQKLARELVKIGLLADTEKIWNITLPELLNGDLAEVARSIAVETGGSLTGAVNDIGEYEAEILSEGSATGAVFCDLDAFESQGVFVAESIEAADYPIFAKCSAGVVAVGSLTYHSAIFARDLGIPLYKSELAAKSLKHGQIVHLGQVSDGLGSIKVFQGVSSGGMAR